MQWSLPQPFVIDVSVASNDVDGLGHANNAAYVTWCETVAWAHSAFLGLDVARYRELRSAMVVHRSAFEYLAPAFADDALRAATWIVRCDGRVRAIRRFEIKRPSDASTLLLARIEFVCVDLESFRPRRMPPEFACAYTSEVIPETPLVGQP